MNPLILSTYDIDGGAARAAYRLYKGLQDVGVTSQMLVHSKLSADSKVIHHKTVLAKLGPSSNALPLKLYSKREPTMFSTQWFPDDILSKVTQFAPDVINLHWICNGFMQIETMAKFHKPIVWTLHDMWAFTGGCHITQGCDRYIDSCGSCPQLKSNNNGDLSRWTWQRKARAWKELSLTIVTPSMWLAKCASSSSLFKDARVEVIPHGLNTDRFKPIARNVARELLNLPQNKQIILFGASGNDKNKGFHLLYPALQNLSKSGWQDRAEVLIFGPYEQSNSVNVGFKAYYLGKLHDDISLALAYSAADVMVVPSIQESFGQTASESLACGTPVVAFNATGLKDIVEHQQNGYLASPYESEDLARGIAWVLDSKDRHQKLSDRARSKAEREFTLELQARRYLSLFTELVK